MILFSFLAPSGTPRHNLFGVMWKQLQGLLDRGGP